VSVIKKLKYVFRITVIIYLIYCLIFKFGIIKTEILTALSLWANIIIPSVFPYLIISQYISNSYLTEKIPGRFISFIFGIHKCSIKAVICSVLCGYPSGAICARTLYDNGEIDIKEAQRLICFTNNAGPLFLISAVGTSLLGSTQDGVVIYLIQLMSSFTYGMITREKNIACHCKTIKKHTHTKGDFCVFVKNAVNICINICGFMIAAYVMVSAVCIFTEDTLGFFFLKPYIKCFFEITAGIKELCVIESKKLIFPLVCGAVSWSGFSVIMQIKSVAGDILSIKTLCKAKFIQAVFSFLIALCYKSFIYRETLSTGKAMAIPISIIGTILIFAIYLFSQKSRYKKFI